MNKLFLIASVCLLASGCASVSGWQPTVDSYGSPNASNLQYDMEQCRILAEQSSSAVKETLMGTGVGSLAGGAGGAAIGAVIGSPAIGAAVGAAGAGITGGIYSGIKADDRYKAAYNSCLRGRGHRVLP